MNARKVLLLVLVLAVAGAVALVSQRPEHAGARDRSAAQSTVPATGTDAPAVGTGGSAAPAAAREPFARASECRSCHEEVWAEWEQSFHGQAWTDPMVQAKSQGFRMTECVDCHAPMPINVTGLGQRVAPRQSARADGIDCLTCHLMDDGVSVAAVHAPDTSKVPGACRPVLVKAMADETSCAGCHNQHQTMDEWASSGVKKACNDCHMPAVGRGAAAASRPGRSHAFPGGHSVEMLRKAVTLEVTVEAGVVVARVANVGAAHHVPTDARHRSFNLFVSAHDARGNPLVPEKQMDGGEFRLYYRDDFRESTQIASGKVGVGRWPVPEGLRGRAKVRLTYALNPDELAARKIATVHEAQVEFP
jgi:nitrate/TMAO reductase-like tetraheme cytochrome c subunit